MPTDDGDFFFKATTADAGFEPELTSLLAQVAPDRTPEVVARDGSRAWLLLRDAGDRLRDIVPPTDLAVWAELLPRYGELQLALAPRVGELLEIGVPDERLFVLPGLLERLLDDPEALLIGPPNGLTREELGEMHARMPEVGAICIELAGYGVPETLQHDDFHDGQVFVSDGRYRFLDWGDSCVSHPFHTLVVTLRSIAYKSGVEPGGPELRRLRDAYLEPFGAHGAPNELAHAVDVAYRTGTVAARSAGTATSRRPSRRSETCSRTPFRTESGASCAAG
ncbi:MAG TPA: phosphotransferase [Gaiellaceae bacterium]|nr:phosphotransferase [Gaiellaceae bacterium]